jgi:hypothetical protein
MFRKFISSAMKSFLKTTVIMGAMFGIPMGLVAGVVFAFVGGIHFGILFGVAGGSASGLLFGLAMAAFMMFQRRRLEQARPELPGQVVLYEGAANHFMNCEGVGGWLYLTKERLQFLSHDFNIQCHEWSVALEEISEVQAVRTAKILANGLRIVTRDGKDERFVVEEHKKWCDEIVKARTHVVQT